MWKCLFSRKFPGNLRGVAEVGITTVNLCVLWLPCLIIIENDHAKILMYDTLTFHGLPKKIFLKYHTDHKSLKNLKIWYFAQIYTRFIEHQNFKGYFDARTEFDFVTHFSEHLPYIWCVNLVRAW